MAYLADDLDRLVAREGVPSGSLSDFELVPTRCSVHERGVRVRLRLSEAANVRVNHCGCHGWFHPDPDAPTSAEEFARGMADAIVWCWRSREDAFAMLDDVRDAFERQRVKSGIEPRDCRLVDVGLSDVETCCSLRYEAELSFDLLHTSMLLCRWHRGFTSEAGVRKFFRQDRLYYLDLAARRDELEASGARGEMDVVAMAALTAAGRDPLRFAAYMSEHLEHLLIDLDGRRLTLRWNKGRIEGEMELAPGVKWCFPEVTVDAALLPTPPSYLGNRNIGNLVAAPFLSGCEPITCVKGGFDETAFVLKAQLRTFRFAAGVAHWL